MTLSSAAACILWEEVEEEVGEMKPIDYFDDQVKTGRCPWNGTNITQTTLTAGHTCHFNHAAGAQGTEPCSAEDWRRCPLLAHQAVPSFRAAVREGEKTVA